MAYIQEWREYVVVRLVPPLPRTLFFIVDPPVGKAHTVSFSFINVIFTRIRRFSENNYKVAYPP
jgi:hypothetical protein